MSEKKSKRPLPVPGAVTKAFWDGTKAHKLMLQYDPVSKAYQFYPRAGSMKTGRRNLEWREASGRGKVYAYTMTHVPTAGFEDRAPYLVGLIDLDEGVRIIANLINTREDQVKIGMKVKVAFETLSDDIEYYCFEPA